MAAEHLYSVATVAKMWGCSADLVYDEIARGNLAATQLGVGRAKTRISESSLNDYVKARTAKHKTAVTA